MAVHTSRDNLVELVFDNGAKFTEFSANDIVPKIDNNIFKFLSTNGLCCFRFKESML